MPVVSPNRLPGPGFKKRPHGTEPGSEADQGVCGFFLGIDPALTGAGKKRVYNDAKLTDHHALIPLAPLPGNCTDRERKIYELVLKEKKDDCMQRKKASF